MSPSLCITLFCISLYPSVPFSVYHPLLYFTLSVFPLLCVSPTSVVHSIRLSPSLCITLFCLSLYPSLPFSIALFSVFHSIHSSASLFLPLFRPFPLPLILFFFLKLCLFFRSFLPPPLIYCISRPMYPSQSTSFSPHFHCLSLLLLLPSPSMGRILMQTSMTRDRSLFCYHAQNAYMPKL